jgi:hypothetical protein
VIDATWVQAGGLSVAASVSEWKSTFGHISHKNKTPRAAEAGRRAGTSTLNYHKQLCQSARAAVARSKMKG